MSGDQKIPYMPSPMAINRHTHFDPDVRNRTTPERPRLLAY